MCGTYFLPRRFLNPTMVFFEFFTSWCFAWLPMYCIKLVASLQETECTAYDFFSMERNSAGNLAFSILVGNTVRIPLLCIAINLISSDSI